MSIQNSRPQEKDHIRKIVEQEIRDEPQSSAGVCRVNPGPQVGDGSPSRLNIVSREQQGKETN